MKKGEKRGREPAMRILKVVRGGGEVRGVLEGKVEW